MSSVKMSQFAHGASRKTKQATPEFLGAKLVFGRLLFCRRVMVLLYSASLQFASDFRDFVS